MKVAIYVRVSTQRQAQTQTIEQQLDLLRAHSQTQGWQWEDEHIFRDDGYSGASLRRPGLDRLRDQVRGAAFDRVVITAPDRLARNYVHQMLLIEELAHGGCQVEFIDRPMSQDPHDQLLLQIRGAVAEYERSLIAERMRRGRLQKYQAGSLLRLYACALWLPGRSCATSRSERGAPGANRGSHCRGDLRQLLAGGPKLDRRDQTLNGSADSQSNRPPPLESGQRARNRGQSSLHRNGLHRAQPCHTCASAALAVGPDGARTWWTHAHRARGVDHRRPGASRGEPGAI